MDHHQATSTNWTCHRSVWSWEENKAFENALATNLGEINSWEKIAAAVPGRTVEEIKNHFEDLCADINAIEFGLVPLPPYADSLKKPGKRPGHATRGREKNQSGKKTVEPSSKEGSSSSKEGSSSNKEGSSRSNGGKKKGVSWSPQEHRLFIEGLEKYGRGDWRSISRHCVLSRTSTQVASHAQKYFKRNEISVAKRSSIIHDVTIMDDEKLVNQRRQTNEVKDSGPPVASIGDSQKSDNANAAYDKNIRANNVGDNARKYPPSESARLEGHEYPILESSDFYSSAYQNAGTLTLKGPRTKRKSGASRVGLTSSNIPSQKGLFTQWPSRHQTVGATDVSFIADQNTNNHGISTSEGPMPEKIVGAPVGNMVCDMSDFHAPVTGEMIGAASGGFGGLASSSRDHMIPQGPITAQTNGTNVGGYINFGETPSLFNSGFSFYSHQTGGQPVLAPAVSTINATNCFGSPVPLTNNIGVSSYDFYAPEHFMDLEDLEFCFPSSDQQ